MKVKIFMTALYEVSYYVIGIFFIIGLAGLLLTGHYIIGGVILFLLVVVLRYACLLDQDFNE